MENEEAGNKKRETLKRTCQC